MEASWGQIEKESYTWDCGQMLVEAFGPGEGVGLIFAELGISDKIKTVRMERASIFPDFNLYKLEVYNDFFGKKRNSKNFFPKMRKVLIGTINFMIT
ncbi:MAG: hypothetical protein ACTSXH_02790 [Promethearchaeota archaeon]